MNSYKTQLTLDYPCPVLQKAKYFRDALPIPYSLK